MTNKKPKVLNFCETDSAYEKSNVKAIHSSGMNIFISTLDVVFGYS